VNTVRIDRWLSASRLFQSRTQATRACDEGRVRVNGATVKASHVVRIGDEISGVAPRGPIVVDVKKLGDKRLSPPLARELYEDRSPPPPPRDELFLGRDRGTGRPTKRDRRDVERFRGR
jgi:ribosome-associated heat shock protein Hsp15